jgi:hypothetical protein
MVVAAPAVNTPPIFSGHTCPCERERESRMDLLFYILILFIVVMGGSMLIADLVAWVLWRVIKLSEEPKSRGPRRF